MENSQEDFCLIINLIMKKKNHISLENVLAVGSDFKEIN